MVELDADGGVHESVHAATRAAFTAALQIAERAIRARTEMLAEAARGDRELARELSARFEAERAAAVAQLQVVQQPSWWETADRSDVVRLAEVARNWSGHDPHASAAWDTIAQQVQYRYGIDLEELAAVERVRAQQDRAEAAVVTQEADRLDTAANSDSGHLEVLPEGQDRALQIAELGKSADVAYDSAERRGATAAAMEAAGIDAADIAVRMRVDTNRAQPAQDAVRAASSPIRAAGASGLSTPARTRTERTR